MAPATLLNEGVMAKKGSKKKASKKTAKKGKGKTGIC
jgi:hypothetical protein